MNTSCDNCGQTVLETDDSCWHCGHLLSDNRERRGVVESPAGEPVVSMSLSAVTAYAGLTVLIFVALLAVTWFLGGRPLNLSAPPQRGWRITADETLSYAFDLPPGWQWLEKSSTQNRDLFADLLASRPQLMAIGAPMSEPLISMELIAIAFDASTDSLQGSQFFTIARYGSGIQVTVDEVMAALEQHGDEFQTLVASTVTHPDGRQTSEITFEFGNGSPALRCLHQAVVGSIASYLLTVCSQRDLYPAAAGDLRVMISSFRILSDQSVTR